VDYEYSGAEYNWQALEEPLRARGIPYLVFSNFCKEIEEQGAFSENEALLLGVFPKDKEGTADLAARLCRFFKGLPFRILHVSDLHFDSAIGKDLEAEQETLYEKLKGVLAHEQHARPIDCLFVTGDFAWRKPFHDMTRVGDHLLDIIDCTVTRDRLNRVFMVPGNHDVKWHDFERGEPDANPWRAYADLVKRIYESSAEGRRVLAGMSAFDGDGQVARKVIRREDLIWHRNVQDPLVDVIGLVSPLAFESGRIGEGEIDAEQLKYIIDEWSVLPPSGAVRIAMVHHNLLGVLSLSSYEKRRTIDGPGKVIHALIRGGCDLVLSGHTHTMNRWKCRIDEADGDGLKEVGDISFSSVGTTGGFHKAKDRRRSFAILEFSDASGDRGIRELRTRSFCYYSERQEWREVETAVRPMMISRG